MDPATKVKLDHVIAATAKEFSVSVAAIMGRNRHQPVAVARQTAQWLALRTTPLKIVEVARVLGYKHNGVIYSVRAVNNRMDVDPAYRSKVGGLLKKLLK